MFQPLISFPSPISLYVNAKCTAANHLLITKNDYAPANFIFLKGKEKRVNVVSTKFDKQMNMEMEFSCKGKS